MNRQQFINLIQSPDLLNNQTISPLHDLLKDFPYCQAVQLLYLKNLQKENSIHYNNQLKISAAYSSNRTLLFQLINEPLESKIEKITENEKVAEPVVIKTEEIPKISIPEKIEREKSADVIELSATTSTEKEEKIQTPVTASNKDRKDELHEIIQKRLSEINYKQKNKTHEFVSEKQEIEIKKDVPEEKIKPEEPKMITPELTEIIEVSPVYQLEEATEIEKRNLHEQKKFLSQQDIINKFIVQRPSMPRVKKEFFNVENKTNQSIIDKGEIVSETLAKLYLNKGNIQKAIEIYQKLSLNFPKKNSYFAELIENIKKEYHLEN